MKDENAESRHDDEHARDPGCDDAQEVPPREAKQSTSLGATPTPPSHPPPMDLAPAEVRRTKAGRAKTKRVKNTIHMAGFVLSEDHCRWQHVSLIDHVRYSENVSSVDHIAPSPLALSLSSSYASHSPCQNNLALFLRIPNS